MRHKRPDLLPSCEARPQDTPKRTRALRSVGKGDACTSRCCLELLCICVPIESVQPPPCRRTAGCSASHRRLRIVCSRRRELRHKVWPYSYTLHSLLDFRGDLRGHYPCTAIAPLWECRSWPGREKRRDRDRQPLAALPVTPADQAQTFSGLNLYILITEGTMVPGTCTHGDAHHLGA